MTPKFLLDTDVIIWHLRGNKANEKLLKSIEEEQPMACSALTVFEIWSGVRQQEEVSTHHLLSALYKIPVDGDIAFKAAEYWRDFRSQGITLGRIDALIAATAQIFDLVLVTYNRDHYPMQDIKLYDPMPQIEDEW